MFFYGLNRLFFVNLSVGEFSRCSEPIVFFEPIVFLKLTELLRGILVSAYGAATAEMVFSHIRIV